MTRANPAAAIVNAITFGAGVDLRPQVYVAKQGLSGTGLVYTRAGRAEFWISQRQRITATPGDLLLLRPAPDRPITYGTAGPEHRWETFWIHFEPRPHWLAWLNWPEPCPGIHLLRLGDRSGLERHILRRLARLCTGRALIRLERAAAPRPVPRQDLGLMLLEEILIACRLLNPLEKAASLDPRVEAAMSFIDAHYARDLTLADLLKVAKLSASQFASLFRDQVDMTPFQYLERRRIRQAINLLDSTELPIAQIAESVGYRDPHYFSKRFHRVTHRTPRAFRRWARGGRVN